MPQISDKALRMVTDQLLRERAIDFREYKPPTLRRRIQRRLEATKCADIDCYVEYLEKHPTEYTSLIDTLLINVTEFFRDPDAWEVIAKEVIPRIMAEKRPGEPVKMWSAGCATGEEAYSLAMLVAEALRGQTQGHDVRIYATDIDDDALMVARRGEYPDGAMEHVPEDLRAGYFTKDRVWTVNRELRRLVIYGKHNLATDAPISRCDLIVCRNVLIYMNVDLQNRILSKFHYSLDSPGYLFLGRAEAMLSLSKLFGSFRERERIFSKEAPGGFVSRETAEQKALGRAIDIGSSEYELTSRFNEAVLRYATVGVLAVDGDSIVRLVNPAAERIWGIRARDLLGKRIADEALPTALQSIVKRALQVKQDRREFRIEETAVPGQRGHESCVCVSMAPILDARGGVGGVLILAEDITDRVQLRRDLEIVSEGLQSTNEELETTNEELQSTNEELATTNEELQSTNEELETTNEELQATNEELQTTNDELESRTTELRRLGDEMESKNDELIAEATVRRQVEAALQLAYDRERNISQTLQRSLLLPVPEDIEGFGLNVKYQAAWDEAEVGGDLYHTAHVAGDRFVVALGDVAGKGLEAAAYGSMTKHMMLGFISESPEPDEMLTRLNRAVYDYASDGGFVTMVYLLLDLKTGSIRYGAAGHEPGIYMAASTRKVSLLENTGPALGIDASPTYSVVETSMEPGDIVLLYTDGLSEAGHPNPMLTSEGLADLLAANASREPSDILEVLHDTATNMSGGRLTDDAASIIIQRR